MDLPTSQGFVSSHPDEFTSRMFGAIYGLLLHVLAAIARKDYDDNIRLGTSPWRKPQRSIVGARRTPIETGALHLF